MRKRTAMRFQVEALEARWTPGGRGGIGGDVLPVHLPPRQVHVAPLVAYGSNSIRAGQEGNAASVACGSKPGIASGSN
jgi:hypothetical protein